MRETYLEPDWWNAGRLDRDWREDSRGRRTSAPVRAATPMAWGRPTVGQDAVDELPRARRIPVRGDGRTVESPADDGSNPVRAAAVAVENDGGQPQQRLRAALADLEASRKRLEREADKQKASLTAALVGELLPVLDNLDRSLSAAAGKADESLLEGLELVRTGFEQVLLRFGAERLGAEGETFDPRIHDAIGVIEVSDAEQDGRVVKEWLTGYRLGERVLRPAQVMVGKLETT